MRHSHTRAPLLLAAIVLAALGGVAYAQQEAIKASCRSDYMAHCASVTPGGQEALACLQKNVAALSPACQQAVSATMPPPAPAAAAKPKLPAPKAKAAAAPAVMPPPPPGPPPMPGEAASAMPEPTPMQLSALKHTCGRDFTRHCRGVPPGGPEAIACLEFNEAKLTPDCKTSLADIADSMAGAMPPPAPPPPMAPLPRPAAPVATGVVVGRACLRDLIMHCRGTGVGEGEKIACLKAYAASGHRLGVLCAAALKITPMR